MRMRCPPPSLEYVIVPAVSNDTRMQSNNVEANFCCFHRISVLGVRFLVVNNRFPQDTPGGSQEMWQTNKNYERDGLQLRVRERLHLRVLPLR